MKLKISNILIMYIEKALHQFVMMQGFFRRNYEIFFC
ncbi:hypothetical protein EUBDOL_02264 [Amedibacillus dolichus DSM 3991]|uniref:Uncharacterized protein n=1 Tax=Amedibacillus dolichus DSM 3991 TaxID=428127 RepID=A8RFJ9_9FIRM|nr:hypothetical protein EUBDOL_02264 [Amedibacillus dolichus DSM 3991]